MWPASFWEKVYEPLIRRAAGLGRAAGADDPDTYEKAFLHCDVLVVGGGAAGLMAALAAGRAGARVVLCEQDFRLGGRLIAEARVLDERSSADWVAHIAAELAALPDVRILPRTTVFGVYDHGTYAALERVNDHVAVPPEHEPRQRFWRIHRQAMRRCRRRDRAAAGVRRQRPSGHHAGRRRAHLSQPLRGGAGAARGRVRHQRRDGAHGRRPGPRRHRRRGRRRPARATSQAASRPPPRPRARG